MELDHVKITVVDEAFKARHIVFLQYETVVPSDRFLSMIFIVWLYGKVFVKLGTRMLSSIAEVKVS